MTLNIYR